MLLHSLFIVIAILFSEAAVGADPPAADPFACSATQPCKIGCCGKNNVCGLGPDYCSPEKCQNSCGAKSDCDPGWGSQWSSREKCPLNVCCSKFGFCGTTEEFCGTKKVNRPSCPSRGGSSSSAQRIIGYYEGWSPTRSCQGMNPESLLVGAYTHLFFAFAFIDPVSFAVAPMSDGDKDLYPRFTGLKTYNPGLETWISIGGWSMNDPDQPTARTFSELAADTGKQQKFFASLLNFMSTYGFDGVDIDWEYPVAPERSGAPEDYANYVSFLKNLKSALGSGGHKYGLSITVPSSYWYLQHFDLKAIEPIIDFFQVMTYDIHGTWDASNPYVGAFVNAHTNLTEIEQTLDLFWRNDINPKNINLGLGFYGRSFTLSDPSCKSPGCPFSAGGNPGPCTASAGTLSFAEISDIVAAGATETVDTKAGVAIVTWDNNQWVSYDNEQTLKQKMDYTNSRCLGGVLIWAASTDDAQGTAIQTLSKVSGRPTLSQAVLAKAPGSGVGQCVWGECASGCPSGLSPVSDGSGKQNGFAGIYNGCPKGQTRYYCCPTGDMPSQCVWRGTAPFCGASGGSDCKNDEIQITSATSGPGSSCWTGHKNLCCKKTKSDSGIGACAWSGSAPICTALGPVFTYSSADCPADKKNKITTSKYGNGGENPCWFRAGFKSFCCSDPVPYKNCAWHQGSGSWVSWANAVLPVFGKKCRGECPPGQVPIATDPSSCYSGYSYFCCDNPNAPALPAPGDVAVCDTGPSPVGTSKDPDPDESSTSGGFFREGETTLASQCNLATSSLTIAEIAFVLSQSNDTELKNALMPRGVVDKKAIMSLCVSGKEVNKLSPQTYTGAQQLIKNLARPVYIIGKPLVCGAFQLTVSKTKPSNQNVVTEHVFEKQQFRDLLERMMAGTARTGKALKAGALKFEGVFDKGGLFYQKWPNVKDLPSQFRPFATSVHDTFMGVLGRSADSGVANSAVTDNLQVLERATNGMKALVIAGDKFIGDDRWKKLGPLQQLGELSRLQAVFDYMGIGAVQTSYRTTFNSIVTLMEQFQKVLSDNGIKYDAVGATKEIIKADLIQIPVTARSMFDKLVDQALEYWESDAALFNHGKLIVDAAIETLKDFQNDAGERIVLDTAKLIGQ